MSDTAEAPRDGLAGMPTGPELAARLAVLEPAALDDLQLLDLITAEWRQLAHQQARTWAAFAELSVRVPSVPLPGNRDWSPARVFDNAVDELRAELLLTRRAAGTELATAARVAALPRVAAALAEGRIDRRRAIVLAEGCWGLTPAHAAALLAEVLPEAGTVTASGLADRIRRVAIALDPGWAARRYRQALRERKVVGYLNPDGSATLAGQNLPAEDAALAGARVDALADAAKRAGATAKIDHLRAEVFLGLLDGRWTGQNSDTIIGDLLRQYPKAGSSGQPDPLDAADHEDTSAPTAVATARPTSIAAGPPPAAHPTSTATSTAAPTRAALERERSPVGDSPPASAATATNRARRSAGPHQPRHRPAAKAARQRKARPRRARGQASRRHRAATRPARPPPEERRLA